MSNEPANQGGAAPHSLTLVIDRAKWLRGEGSDESSLLRSADGKMCCLGFYALACGLPPEQIQDQKTPWGSHRDRGARWPDWFFLPHGHTKSVCDLMDANDAETMPSLEREADIAHIFAKHGVTVEFVGDAAPAAPKEPQP